MNKKKTVVVIGAGPAGLTAALELLRSGIALPVVVESDMQVGGISKTVDYKGFRMDIGGHRFFSKSEWVMNWWREILPICDPSATEGSVHVAYRGQSGMVAVDNGLARNDGKVMLVRNRLSRIYFLRKYFDYPIRLTLGTLRNLGVVRLIRMACSYAWAMAFPRREERSLEDFLINRFGGGLYRTFFKDYTEKVWGVECRRISAEWGAQRIKGLSVIAALRHALLKPFRSVSVDNQKKMQTSLIERFLYPRLGPGQLWEEVAHRVTAGGGTILMKQAVVGVHASGQRIDSVTIRDTAGNQKTIVADAVISSMPVKDLIAAITPPAPPDVAEVAANLPYRDFITVGLLLRKMLFNPQSGSSDQQKHMPPDNWIYIQERDVRIGRLQIFNNWSPDLVADPDCVWLGLEYFCQEGDDLWSMSDEDMLRFAASELAKISMIEETDVIDGTVVRVSKTYPAYFGAYAEFGKIRHFVDDFENLYLVGRNGMHRYNNQDHSMLTAKLAVEAIVTGCTDKSAIWAVNVDDEYHEEK